MRKRTVRHVLISYETLRTSVNAELESIDPRKKRDAIVLGYTSDPQPDHRGQAVRENGPDMSRCERSEKEAKLCVVVRHQASTSACRRSVALVHVVVQIMSLTTSRHKIRLHPACQHVCCLVVALIPCEAPRQRTSSTVPTILSWTISKLTPASRYLLHIPANSEFFRSRDRAQRKRYRSSQQLGSGKQLKSTQLLNLRCKIAVGDQL